MLRNLPLNKKCLNLNQRTSFYMENISFEGNINYDNKDEKKICNEFFSLRINDSLYKKDIGKFLETLSNHFIQKYVF